MAVTLPLLFMSYSIDDGEFAQRLRNDLQAQGYDVWIDKIGLQPGTADWEEALRQAIRRARAVLLVASPSSRSSSHVKDELRISKMYGQPLIPIWARGDEWMDSIPLGW